jgi:flagellar basal body-associated protein FliL
MTNPQTPAPSPDAPKGEEIPLEDIDKLLEAEDPGFNKSLEEVRNVEVDKSVVIEATITDEGFGGEEAAAGPSSAPAGWRKITAKMKNAWFGFRMRLRARMATLGKDAVIFLKTKPKEYALYAIVILKTLFKNAAVPVNAFRKAERLQQFTALALMALGVACAWVLLANVKGIWIPSLTEPILRSFEDYADSVDTYNPKEEGESFYTAFPQERYEFLFQKMKVNLRRTSENANPMGAFELIVLLDSKDTGIEVRDREVEFYDLLSRALEEESFTDLESELGKGKLKSRLKRELNQRLTQGWVKDVSFKTFILKP